MSANLKGSNGAVRFLLAHGEKIGIAIVAICAAMLIWSALGRERLEQGPDDLEQLISRAKTNIQQANWVSAPEEEKLMATDVNTEAMKPIPREHFPKLDIGLDRSVLDPIGLRTDPQLLTVEDLEVHGDAGLWVTANPEEIERRRLAAAAAELRDQKARDQARDEQDGQPDPRNRPARDPNRRNRNATEIRTPQARGGPIVVENRNTGIQLDGYETITARSWVTVLGKVPIRQQYQLYDEALANARGYDAKVDMPEYIGYVVERAEVTGTGLGDWKQIVAMHRTKLMSELDTYPAVAAPVIDPRYDHPFLTHPLPPVILREWDKRVTHSSMPLEPVETSPTPAPEAEEVEDAPAEAGLFGAPIAARRPDRGRPNPNAPMERGAEGLGEPRGRVARGAGPLRQPGAPLPEFVLDQTTSNVLFRYFDTTAEPGHKYRYRIGLALRDVNDISSKHYLDPAVVERREKSGKPYRLTEWSEPSPIVSVPFPARVHLAGADPARNYNDEPEAELLIKALSSNPPAEVARLESFLRGSVINVREEATVIWANRYQPEGSPEFDFRTGITLLDFNGGERLSSGNRDLAAPTRAVFMDAAGRLFLQEELDDYEPVAEFQQIVAEAEESRRRLRAAADE